MKSPTKSGRSTGSSQALPPHAAMKYRLRDTSLALTRHYDDVLDDIILRAKQAQDYFLLV